MYTRKDTIFKNSIEREEYHDGRRGAPGQKRGQKKKLTPDQMKEYNLRNKRRRAARFIKYNFTKDDYWTTFTYKPSERPASFEASKIDFKNMIRRVKDRYKKAGAELKYWGVIEQGAKGAIHFHIIINRTTDTDKILKESWTKGMVHCELMFEDEDGGFRDLVDYMLKRPGETDKDGHTNHMIDKWESRSRNLAEPPVKKKILWSATFRKGPSIPKGYYLDKNSLREGIDKFTGYKCRSYTLIKIQEKPKRRRI